jgi:hypothetical protein
LQTQGSFNDKLVMSKPSQLAKLIELRKISGGKTKIAGIAAISSRIF